MAKKLKKVEYDEAAEVRFRYMLQESKQKANPKFQPSMDLVPDKLKSKVFRYPDTFASKLKSNDEAKIFLEFIKYTFGKYKVPRIMDQAWIDPNYSLHNNRHISFENWTRSRTERAFGMYDYRAWWVCVATGGSLYKDHCKDFLTKKEVHTLINCPHNINLDEAVIYSVAIGYGASPGIALRIAKSKIKEHTLKGSIGTFWRNVIHFFVMHTPETIQKINDLCDYIRFKRNEDNNYTVLGQGYTLESMFKKMKDWHYAMARIKAMGDGSWDGVEIPDFTYETKDAITDRPVTWKIIQIKTAKELAAEGNAMHHCVYSYRTYAQKGECSIWSLRSYDEFGTMKRHVTIELRNNRIVQARRFANASPRSNEMNIIGRWRQANNLDFNNW